MKKLEELLKKRITEIENEKIAKRKDKKNYIASILAGILLGVIGAVGGGIAGFIIALILCFLEILGSFFMSNCEWSNNNVNIIVISSMVIGGMVGYFGGFSSVRKQY